MSKFTPEQHANSLLLRKAAAEKAAPIKNIAQAFFDLVAAWDREAPGVNIEYAFPCGSRLKIVCLETAKRKAERAGKPPKNRKPPPRRGAS